MKVYTVHTRDAAAVTAENTELVPESFSWISIIYPFNLVWAIAHRMWLFLVVLLVFFIGSIALDLHNHELSNKLFLVKVAIMVFIGIWANDFRRMSLRNRGFKLNSIVTGKNESEAQLRYFEDLTQERAA